MSKPDLSDRTAAIKPSLILPSTAANPHPTVQVTGDKQTELGKKIIEASNEELVSRQDVKVLAPTAFDKQTLGALEEQKPEAAKSFDQKIYMFPESYNALRKELMDNWPEIWPLVAWHMAHNGPDFVSIMNAGLQMNVQFDSNKVDATCIAFLNRLREMRGVSPIN